MEYNPNVRIPFTEQQWENYKKCLHKVLSENALDCKTVANNEQYSQFLANFVQTEIIDNDTKNKIQGITYRLVNMDVETKDGIKTYPIANKYYGHHIKAVVYFKLNDEDHIEVATVDVDDSTLLV